MKKLYTIVFVFVCLFATTASAQEPKPLTRPSERTVILDISIIEMSASRAEEIEKAVKDKAALERMFAEGRAQPIASVQMRARSGEPTSTRVGQRVPIQTATLPVMAPQGDTQREQMPGGQFVRAGIPQIQYENTGLSVDAVPSLVGDNQIEVRLKIEMTGVDKSTGAMTPSFIQRSIHNTVRVREGETSVLLGVVQHESLAPSPQAASQPSFKPRGSFAVLLTARVIE